MDEPPRYDQRQQARRVVGEDDFYYQPLNNQRQQYHNHQRRHRRPSQPLRIGQIPYLTGQNLAILTAIVVIVLFQRKEFLAAFGRSADDHAVNTNDNYSNNQQHAHWTARLFDWLLRILDQLRGSIQLVIEMTRSITLSASSGDDWVLQEAISPHPSPSTLGRRRSIMMRNAAGNGRTAAGIMPELEDVSASSSDAIVKEEANATEYFDNYHDKENTDPLEPAFLRDEDYPPGWLVYDPVLGIVSKTESDKYQREQQQKNTPTKKSPSGSHQQPSTTTTKTPTPLSQKSIPNEEQSNNTPMRSRSSSSHSAHSLSSRSDNVHSTTANGTTSNVMRTITANG